MRLVSAAPPRRQARGHAAGCEVERCCRCRCECRCAPHIFPWRARAPRAPGGRTELATRLSVRRHQRLRWLRLHRLHRRRLLRLHRLRRPQALTRQAVYSSKICCMRVCRFCHESSAGGLFVVPPPCLCSGSIKWVHRRCLHAWRATSEKNNDKADETATPTPSTTALTIWRGPKCLSDSHVVL